MNLLDNVLNVVVLAAIIVSIVWMVKGRKSVMPGQKSEIALTGKEKALMWVLCLLSPIISGAIFYYGWIKKLPKKAKQANNISLLAFVLLILLSFAFFSTEMGQSMLRDEMTDSEFENLNS